MVLPKATYEVIYNGTNITAAILPCVISFTYTDKAKSEADEIELTLEDSDRLWQNEWYPTKGDTIVAKIFLLGQVLNCGIFTVDEIAGTGSRDVGDTISIKGIAAGINKKIRTKTSFAHENKTLGEIANTVASKHGFTVQGNIDDVRIARETQYRESDLSFLNRLAGEYGYAFSIRDKQIIFTNIFELENKKEALTIHRAEMLSWSITDKISKTYKAVRVMYHNPKQKKLIQHEQQETIPAYEDVKADTLEIRVRADNKQQAEKKGRSALYRANSLQQNGNVQIPGNLFALAGNNCELVEIGMFSGKYYIEQSTHRVSKDSDYTTDLDVKRIGLVEAKKRKT